MERRRSLFAPDASLAHAGCRGDRDANEWSDRGSHCDEHAVPLRAGPNYNKVLGRFKDSVAQLVGNAWSVVGHLNRRLISTTTYDHRYHPVFVLELIAQMQKNALTLTRQELYDLVWAKPMVQVAAELGMSDVGLAKRCRAVSVPVPPRGYWARKEAGQNPARPKLPKYRSGPDKEPEPKAAPEERLQGPEPTIVFDFKPTDGTPNYRLPQDDSWLAERHAFDAEPGHTISYEESPTRWHRSLISQRNVLRAAAKELEKSRKDYERYEALPLHRQRLVEWERHGSDWRQALHKGGRLLDYHKPRPFRVSSASMERALAISNAIAIAAQARSFTFEEDQGIGRFVVKGHGGLVSMRITEQLEAKIEKVRRYDGKFEAEKRYKPTGTLKLSLDKSYGSTIDVSDTSSRPLEAQLPRAMEAIYELIVRHRMQERKREHWRQQQQLEDEARARAAEIRRKEERKRALEAKRQRTLIRHARRWEQATGIRAYVSHVDRSLRSLTPDIREQFGAWEAWALNVAQELDPTAATVTELSSASYPAAEAGD